MSGVSPQSGPKRTLIRSLSPIAILTRCVVRHAALEELRFMGLLGGSGACGGGALYQRVRLKHSANFFRASPVFLSGTLSFREPRSVSLSVGAVANFATICLFAERTTPGVPRYPYGSNSPHRSSSKTSSINLTSDSSSRFPENFFDASGGGAMAPVKRESARLVRRHWDAIESVAVALIERGQLSGDEVDTLLDMALASESS